MIITKITRRVNGIEWIYYRYNGKEYKELSDLLRDNFENQGEFYQKVVGVDVEKASLAKWHPDDRYFNSSNCGGWKKFIEDGGKITEEIIEEQVDVLDEILNQRED